ncbi:hypothetical protein, partial [Glaciecola sp. SC05]|uniref:hypothetical protein n=1 Tax=Glaciecola sp. SC05 TaxID=1987355 RepID=UPI003529C196
RKKGQLSTHNGGGAIVNYYFDALARPTLEVTEIDATRYNRSTEYDANHGRVKATTFPNGLKVAYHYNSVGYLQFERNAASGYVYKQITAQDVFGNIVAERTANNKTAGDFVYSYATGQMQSASVKRGTAAVHSLTYSDYDSYGNIERQENYV